MIHKKILILGANEYQTTLIIRAKALGLHTVVCDPRTAVPGMALADTFYNVDCFDIEKVVAIGKKENVDGVVTNSEHLLKTMSQIALKLNLRALDIETIELYCDKNLMREFCKKIGIVQPQYQCCYTLQEALAFYNRLQKKCIIKPLDNSASKGVFSINSQEELEMYFDECIANACHLKAILIEEYITGTEFTIDGIKTSEGHQCLAISEKKHYAHNENVACQLYFSNENPEYDYSILRQQNDYLVNNTNMAFGLTHSEYKYYDGKYYLIEIQARGGGSFIATDIVPYISGIDPYDKFIEWCVGENVIIPNFYDKLSNRCAVLHFFDSDVDEGVVASIEGEDVLKACTKKYALRFDVGDRIMKAANDGARIGYYIACEEDDATLRNTMKKIDQEFKLTYHDEKL